MLQAEQLAVQFGQEMLFRQLSLTVPPNRILAIVGPNGSGKSTLLRILARSITPQQGSVVLDGKELGSFGAGELARCLAFMPQSSSAPADITVQALVSHGRFPHQSWWKNTSREDKLVVEQVMEKTGLLPFADRLVSTLSGGERQRVWLAMSLAQQPKLLLLDEPTTYLDMSHQLEILSLIAELNKQQGITVVMVLHEINLAARYADCLAVMQKGRLFAVGSPAEVVNREMLRDVFGVEANVWLDDNQCPVCIPYGLTSKSPVQSMKKQEAT